MVAAAREILLADSPELSWVGEENWHLTLAFLGERDAAGVEAAHCALARLGSAEPPRLEFGRIATFPPRGPWRVLVLGLSRAEGLQEVYTVLNRALEAEGRKRDLSPLNPERTRLWTPHITLARKAKASQALPSPELRARAEALLQAESPKGGWLLGAAMLYKSDLRPGGAVYTELDRAFFHRL